MYARAVDDAGARLRELHREEWEDLALAGAALALAAAASALAPSLAVPLFVGGLASGILGVRALWRHWDLVDRLAGDRDAYVIPEVRAYASRWSTRERRLTLAAIVRAHVAPAGPSPPRDLGDAARELEALAAELEDDDLELDPACAVACFRLVSEPAESPLLDDGRSRAALHDEVRRIRAGFSARRPAS